MDFSLSSPFDHSFLCVHRGGPGFGGLGLRDLDLDVPTQSGLCQDHPPSAPPITHVPPRPPGLQPQQQLRSAQQQQFGERRLQLPPADFLRGSPRSARPQIQLQGLHLPPSAAVQPNRARGGGREPDHAAAYADADHVSWIASDGSPAGRRPTQTRVVLGEQRPEGFLRYTDPTSSIREHY